MADNSIEVKISADASGFRAGAQEAAAHSTLLRDRLIELKQEHVQSARVARFYATEIADIVPGADAARESLQALVKVGLAEGAFGVAIAGVGLLVAAFHEVSEAIDKTKEHFKKLEEDAEQYSTKIQKHVADVIAALQGETEAEAIGRKEVLPFLVQKIALVDKLSEATKRLADIEANVDENGGVADVVGLVKAQSRVEDLKKQLEALQTKFGAAVGGAGEIGGANANAERQKKIADDINASMLHRTEMLKAEQVIDTSLWAKDVERQQVAFDMAEELRKQAVAERDMLRDAENIVSPLTLVADQERRTAEEASALADALRLQDAEAKKLQHELGQAAKEMGDALGRDLADVLNGTKSIDEALSDMLATLIKVATQMAVMAALSAGGPLGFIGALGIGAAGSFFGGIFGGGGGHLSAAGGGMTNHITINGSGLSDRQMETAVVNALRSAQGRGRI